MDVEAIHAARRRSSFDVIHLETMLKVDIFASRRRPFDRAQFERRQAPVVATDPERRAYVASAEDTVLAKLEWYRQGGEQSERQWRDVIGVLTAQAGCLDVAYLGQWATRLGVADILTRAMLESGIEGEAR